MIIVQGHARFAPGTIAVHHDALIAMVTATRAEDGCDLYAFAFDALDPDCMHITERWRDQAALDAHMASTHMAEFRKTIAAVTPVELVVGFFDAEPQKR
jgi:quinol monooxygenase YgiN